jgi:hypothetical protein
MPIKIRSVCKHCLKPISQQGYYGEWYHKDREPPLHVRCDPTRAAIPENLATPRIDVVKRGEP